LKRQAERDAGGTSSQQRWSDHESGFSDLQNSFADLQQSDQSRDNASKVVANPPSKTIVKRDQHSEKSLYDEMILVSMPRQLKGTTRLTKVADMKGIYYTDDSQGKGQIVYQLDFGYTNHPVSEN
jgi:hypothetical protein